MNRHILDVTVDPGNFHDSISLDWLYKRLERFQEMCYAVSDTGCKTPCICKRVVDDSENPILPYNRPMGKDGFFRHYELF